VGEVDRVVVRSDRLPIECFHGGSGRARDCSQAWFDPGTGTISQTLFFLMGGISGVVLAMYSDHVGRRKVLLYSLIAMCVGTILGMLAPNVLVLMIGRLLQGACGATFQITYLIMREMLTPDSLVRRWGW
jgi:MFS family permease